MLILDRNPGESIKIDDEITVTVMSADEKLNQVKIGIHAPREIEVHREEIYQKIQSAKQAFETVPVKDSKSVAVYSKGRKRLADVTKAPAEFGSKND